MQDNELEKFDFPSHMIAAQSKSGFPDFVLKANSPGGQFTGGELIELKSTKSHQIASFNSTIPSEKKQFVSLPKNVQKKLIDSGETAESLPIRDVYYLIRGIKESQSYPLSKTILVSGAFFQTMPVDELLANAFNQVAADSMGTSNGEKLVENFKVAQDKFAATRTVEDSAVSVRFRVMAQIDPRANLLDGNRYPMIGDNTLTMLVNEPSLDEPSLDEPSLEVDQDSFSMHDWASAPKLVKKCSGYRNLNDAYDEVDAGLKEITRVSVLKHPLNGPFFLAQASSNPHT